jgi:hypothetical protein
MSGFKKYKSELNGTSKSNWPYFSQVARIEGFEHSSDDNVINYLSFKIIFSPKNY